MRINKKRQTSNCFFKYSIPFFLKNRHISMCGKSGKKKKGWRRALFLLFAYRTSNLTQKKTRRSDQQTTSEEHPIKSIIIKYGKLKRWRATNNQKKGKKPKLTIYFFTTNFNNLILTLILGKRAELISRLV